MTFLATQQIRFDATYRGEGGGYGAGTFYVRAEFQSAHRYALVTAHERQTLELLRVRYEASDLGVLALELLAESIYFSLVAALPKLSAVAVSEPTWHQAPPLNWVVYTPGGA